MSIINYIPVTLETEEILSSLKLNKNKAAVEKKIEELIISITPAMRPKAIYAESKVQSFYVDKIVLDGHEFNSKVLVKNLSDQKQCYPYIVTAGQELDNIELPKEQSLMLLDLVKNIVVEKAFQYTKALILERYKVKQISEISPGHLDDWPLNQQKVLFELLGSDVEKIGVKLTNAFLMKPIKTVSGILFTSEKGFQSCQVCTQTRCMGRKTEYDPVIAKMYGL